MKKLGRKSVRIYAELDARERDWIIANEGSWSIVIMSQLSGIDVHAIANFLNTIGRENCARIRRKRHLAPVTHEEAMRTGVIPKPKRSKLEELWTDHTIAEVARELGWSFPSTLYEARKKYHLPLSAAKEQEVEERMRMQKANRLNNYIPPSGAMYHSDVWDLYKPGGGYEPITSGAKKNGDNI